MAKEEFPEEQEGEEGAGKKKGGKKLVLVLILLVIVGGLGIAGFLLKDRLLGGGETPEPGAETTGAKNPGTSQVEPQEVSGVEVPLEEIQVDLMDPNSYVSMKVTLLVNDKEGTDERVKKQMAKIRSIFNMYLGGRTKAELIEDRADNEFRTTISNLIQRLNQSLGSGTVLDIYCEPQFM